MVIRLLGILLLSLSSVQCYSENINTYIPGKAYVYIDLLKNELNTFFPEINDKHYFAGLAEQESCISLKHKKCWDPRSQLKTNREEGAGIFQLTRAYKSDGSIRFDSLAEMRNKHNNYLKELSWDTIYNRPDLQIMSALPLLGSVRIVKNTYGTSFIYLYVKNKQNWAW